MEPNKRVFINCPYDDQYKYFFTLIIFFCFYFGYEPVFALEESGGQTRIDKIIEMIDSCDLGIHDLSAPQDEYPRYNMPFEFGLDFMFRYKGKTRKKMLILDKEEYEYRRTISDISGCDVCAHNNDDKKLANILRKFFMMFDKYDEDTPKGKGLINLFMTSFNLWIQTEGMDSGDRKYEDMEMSEIKQKAEKYFRIHKDELAKKISVIS